MATRRVRTAWVLSLVSLALTAAVLLGAHAGRPLAAALVGLTQASATVAVVLRARGESGRRRRAWGLLPVAILAYTWTSVAYIVDRDAAMRFPSLDDVSILTYPTLLVPLVLFWLSRAPRGIPWLMLDAGIAGLALAALVEWLLIAPRIGGPGVGLTTYGQVLYATGDTFLLGFALTGAVLVEWPPARAAPWLAGGLALMSAADATLAARVASGQLTPSRFTELAWAGAMVVLAGAATTQPRRESGPPLRWAAVVVPAGSAALALPVVIAWRPGDDVARLVIATLALALAGLRLALSLAENIRLVALARAAEARQATLAELGRQALATDELDRLFADASRLATETVGADFGAVLEHDGAMGPRTLSTHGMPLAPGEHIGGGATMLAARSDRPVVVEDWHSETRFAQPESVRRVGGRSAVLVAVPSRARAPRVLAVGCRRPRAYGASDIAFLESVANVLATALDRIDARLELRRLAAVRRQLIAETLEAEEKERRRIADGLHDLALQEVLAARQELDDISEPGQPSVSRAREGLARAAHDLRETVTELHPVVLEHAGLESALESLLRRQAQRAGFAYELNVDPGAARGREEVLVSLGRELVGNVARHAGAAHVWVEVAGGDHGVALEVRDDGRGVGAGSVSGAARAGHIGLASWTERIEALGGTLSLSPEPGGGTRVRAELPRP